MRDLTDTPMCEYSNELISFLYDELTDRQAQEFKVHLNICRVCSKEVESFGQLRNSIDGWKYQALAGLSSYDETAVQQPRKKSALSALREFFDLSPLWLKGAVGFAAVIFCFLALIATGAIKRPSPSSPAETAKTYDEREVREMIAEALAQRAVETEESQSKEMQATAESMPQQKQSKAVTVPQLTRSRRPLSRAEREQLAADLRLAVSNADDNVSLIGDRIND